MTAALVPIDDQSASADADPARRQMVSRMAAISLDEARAARDEGMKRALDHAERDVPAWSAVALQFLRGYAAKHRQFTSFELRNAAREWGLSMPATDKAFGSVFVKAAKEGVIERAGYVPHPERHASPTVLWNSLTVRVAA